MNNFPSPLNNLMKSEDYKKIEMLDVALKNNPQNAAILVEKGRIFYSKMADDLAVDAFKQAIQVNPNYVDAYFWLAECLAMHWAEWEEAEKIVLQGLQIDPNNQNLINLLATARESIALWNEIIQKSQKNEN